jgi:hypothetical protein
LFFSLIPWQIVALALRLLADCPLEEEECKYRALVALGTLLPEHSRTRLAARERGALSAVGALTSAGGRVGEAAAEVERQLRL